MALETANRELADSNFKIYHFQDSEFVVAYDVVKDEYSIGGEVRGGGRLLMMYYFGIYI